MNINCDTNNSSNEGGFFNEFVSNGKEVFFQPFHHDKIPSVPVISPSILFKPNEFEYLRVIRHLKKEDLCVLEKKIKLLAPYQQEQQKRLLHALNNLDWKDAIFQNAYFLYALEAFRNGALTREQFMTLVLYWAAAHYNTRDKKASSLRNIPLFNHEGEPNKEAWSLIGQSMVEKDENFFNEAALMQLFERMKHVPFSERQFFVYEVDKDKDSQMITSLTKDLEFNFLIKAQVFTTKKIVRYRLVPSVSLMQQALYVVFQEQAVEIDTILGICPFKQITHNAVDGQRSMSFPFPFIKPLPEKADNLDAPGIDFISHDFYHAYLVSCVPSSHRYAFARAVNVLESQGDKTEEHKKYLKELKDMEVIAYRKKLEKRFEKHHLSSSEKFWLEMLLQTEFVKKNKNEPSEHASLFIPILIDYFQHQEEWKQEFHITLEKESKSRILAAYISTVRDLMRKPANQEKVAHAWNIVESAWSIQGLIQENKFEEAKEKIEKFFQVPNLQPDFSKKSIKIAITQPEHAYFFATFNDQKAFKRMLTLLPETVLPIYLSGCQLLNDDVFKEVFQHLKGFGKNQYYCYENDLIDLSGCRYLTGQTLKILGAYYSQVNLSGCDSILNDLSFLSNKTKKLILNNIKNLKNEDLSELQNCEELESLSLKDNPNLTDEGLKHLIKLKNLKEIQLSGCSSITLEGIERLMELDLISIEAKRCGKPNPEKLALVLEKGKSRGIECLF